MPTLIVVGTDDVFTPVSESDDMEARLPNAELQVIDHVGHLPSLESLAVFNTLLKNFLERTRL